MRLRIGKNRMEMLGAAAMSLFLLVSAFGQTTRENTATPPGASPNASAANAAPNSSNRNSQELRKGMLVRISEIEIHANHLEEYKAILKEEAEASVRLERGVISIFPMYKKEKRQDYGQDRIAIRLARRFFTLEVMRVAGMIIIEAAL